MAIKNRAVSRKRWVGRPRWTDWR